MRIRALWILPLILAGLPDRALPAAPATHPAHAPIAFPGYRSRVSGINSSGTVIGYYNWVDGTLHAFAYMDGRYRDLKPPAADGSSLTLLTRASGSRSMSR